MKPKSIVVVSILGLVFLVGLLRINHLHFLQRLRNDAEQFKIDYAYFRDRYHTGYPKEKKDIEFMLDWMKENRSEVDYTFLDLGYNIKHYPTKTRSYLYSFGRDGKDDGLKSTPFNSENYYKSFLNSVPIINEGFKEYIFSWFRRNDVILIDIPYTDLGCPKGNPPLTYQNLFSGLELYKGVKNLRGSVYDKKFKDAIVNFCKTELGANLFGANTRLLVAINEKKGITIECPRNLPIEQIRSIKEKLSNYLEDNNLDFFDHALFHLYIGVPE